ncbi:MAG: universal stress protein [Dehalococcoidia bacterium]|nr:universal stress protein [Dehalococcoidia bacterium]
MYKRILVPLDGSKLAEGILPTVARFASGLKARVELLSVVEEDVVAAIASPMKGRYQDQVGTSAQTVARDYLTNVAGQIKLPNEQVKCTAKVAIVPEAIVAEAAKEPDTLIAMSTHGRSGIGRWVLGSVADKVLHGTLSPLLLYRARQDGGERGELTTVVVPLDGSDMAESILPHVEELAKALELRVHLVRVTSTMTEYYAGEGFYTYPVDLVTELENDAKAYLEKKAQELKSRGVRNVTVQHLRGAPAIQIVDLVKEMRGSFVAICSHGRSGVGRWVLGSVADRVVTNAGAPALIVRG